MKPSVGNGIEMLVLKWTFGICFTVIIVGGIAKIFMLIGSVGLMKVMAIEQWIKSGEASKAIGEWVWEVMKEALNRGKVS